MSRSPSRHAGAHASPVLLRALALLALVAGGLVPAVAPRSLDAAAASRHDPRADGTITGIVSDTSGSAVEGAQVQLRGTSHGAMTTADGRYLVKAPPGTYVLVVRRIGYQSREIAGVVVRSGATREVNLTLTMAAAQLSAQRIVGAPAPLIERGVAGSTQSLSANATGSIPMVSPSPRMARAGSRTESLDHLRRAREPGNTENYARIEENPFLGARANPLSTFSIDVDRASYANVRRFLVAGARPPRDAVRIEELVNYFRYDYAEPTGAHPVAIHTEIAPAPWNPEHRLLKVGLQGRKIDLRQAPANNLVFLIDVSGSMQPGNRLPLLKRSFALLVDQLREQDRVAIVVYAGAAGLVLPSTSGAEKPRIHAALEALSAGGSTAGGAGIRLAYEIARQHRIAGGNNRVILATDGDFNVGTSSDAELVQLVEEKRGQGTFLTVLGVGMGNYKDNRLEQLADKGNGNFAYIDNLMEARKVLVTEMGGTLVTVAKDVKLQVEFNPARVAAYRLIGYENRMLRAEDFDDDAKDAGELGSGHTVTALYEVIPVGARTTTRVRGVDSLRYRRPAEATTRAGGTDGDELAFVKLRYKAPTGERSLLLDHAVADRTGQASDDFTFAASVAAFGMLLRDSEHRGSATWPQVLALARRGRGPDAEGYRAEFLRLVEGVAGSPIATTRPVDEGER